MGRLRVSFSSCSVSAQATSLASVLGTDLFSVVSARIGSMEPAGQVRLASAGVTAREAEVLAVIGGRLTNSEIADRLCISVRTVESHVSALLRKLALPGRPALIQLAGQLAAGPALPAP